MQLRAATWSGDDSELNLAPGQVALSSANYRVQRLGGSSLAAGCSRGRGRGGGGASRERRYSGASEKRRLAAVLNLSQSQVSAAAAPRARLCPPPQGGDGPRAASALAPLLKAAGEEGRPPPVFASAGTSASPRGRGRGQRQVPQARRVRLPVGLTPLAESRPKHAYSPASAGTALSCVKPEAIREWKTVNANLKGETSPEIKTWFQNRRMKFKRQTHDARVEALFSGLFLPYHCYPDIATSSYSHGMDINVSSTSAVSLHPAMPSPALLLPSVPAQSLQPVLPSPALLLPPSPGLSCYSSVIPAMTLTDDHKRLMFQPYLPSC
ncbi:PREDICTED: homeobox protein vex1-like [Nipponia nippon]|uniref:homeobox protein vex1-like n=1 Tax=Nipponia nippon TaxID=128390 RepID=UPI00051130BA|nr:PREDICTED: homeobox protein vex1-like [Nipponia nippon]